MVIHVDYVGIPELQICLMCLFILGRRCGSGYFSTSRGGLSRVEHGSSGRYQITGGADGTSRGSK